MLQIFITVHIKKHLSHDALISDYANCIQKLLDHRREKSNDYEVFDVMMSALACMYMQSPSLLAFQKRLEKNAHKNNLISMFKVRKTPGNTAMKDFIDEVPPSDLAPIFKQSQLRWQLMMPFA